MPGSRLLFVFFCGALLSAARAQPLDDTWRVTVAGQTVQVNPDGSFFIPNITAPDLFGPSGPGSPPDFLSDDFLRLVGVREFGGTTRYCFSEHFQIRTGQTFQVESLTFTDVPPRLPRFLRLTIDFPVVNRLNTSVQATTTAVMPDGSVDDVTPRTSWTVYRTSSPSIATVGPNGLITAVSAGTAFITAINEGATSVARFDVVPGDPLTTLVGLVQDRRGDPVSGIPVRLFGRAESAVTDAGGGFSIPSAPTTLGEYTLLVAQTGETPAFGRSLAVVPNPGGITDAGLIVVETLAERLGREIVDTDGDCLEDDLEIQMGFDPNEPDSDGNTIPDGDEDPDEDNLGACMEVFLGSSPVFEDGDLDTLLDVEELFTYGTSPLRADSDGDSLRDDFEVGRGTSPLVRDTDRDQFSDDAELLVGADPLDRRSRPGLLSLALPAPTLRLARSRGLDVAAGVTVGRPTVKLGLNSSATPEGLMPGLTVGAPPVVTRLSTSQPGNIVPGLTVGRPPARVEFVD